MPTLPTRRLGKSGPYVSALGFGTMGLSVAYGAVEENEARFAVLDRALELGSTFWDSSDVCSYLSYSLPQLHPPVLIYTCADTFVVDADSEDLLRLWFERTGKRDQIFLATKFAVSKDKDGNFMTRSDPEYVKQACEKSLKRLGVEKIDLYYCHRVDRKTPIEETVKALAELKKYDSSTVSYIAPSLLRNLTRDTERAKSAISASAKFPQQRLEEQKKCTTSMPYS
jgi:aryl-alcohol dehydrogenase-like predicted oxidoreductase